MTADARAEIPVPRDLRPAGRGSPAVPGRLAHRHVTVYYMKGRFLRRDTPYPIDLLLCGHHYRVSQAALLTAGAVVYDETGVPITAGTSDYQHSSHKPAAASPRP